MTDDNDKPELAPAVNAVAPPHQFHNDHRCHCGAYGSHGVMRPDTRIHEIEWRCEAHKST
jgi:hypothetical protein